VLLGLNQSLFSFILSCFHKKKGKSDFELASYGLFLMAPRTIIPTIAMATIIATPMPIM